MEESATIALCQLPNQRIVSSGGALVVAPNASQLRTVLDADARAFRALLEQISKSIEVQYSFERTMGDLVQNALNASVAWDIIVFGHRHIHPVRGKIVLLEASGTPNQELVNFADHLVHAASADCLVFTVGSSPAAPRRGRHFGTIQDALAELARMNVEGVLVDLVRGPIHTPDDLRHLLELARCPVFAFGPARSGTELEHSTQIPPAPDMGARSE